MATERDIHTGDSVEIRVITKVRPVEPLYSACTWPYLAPICSLSDPGHHQGVLVTRPAPAPAAPAAWPIGARCLKFALPPCPPSPVPSTDRHHDGDLPAQEGLIAVCG